MAADALTFDKGLMNRAIVDLIIEIAVAILTQVAPRGNESSISGLGRIVVTRIALLLFRGDMFVGLQ